jgi:hypothetical protein
VDGSLGRGRGKGEVVKGIDITSSIGGSVVAVGERDVGIGMLIARDGLVVMMLNDEESKH